MRQTLIKCTSWKKRNDNKHYWQIRWENFKGFVFCFSLGLMDYKTAKKARAELRAWQKKWKARP